MDLSKLNRLNRSLIKLEITNTYRADVYDLARKCLSYGELDSILFECIKKKTALSKKKTIF